MAGIEISALPAVVTADGNDTLPVVQDGVTKKETLTQIADYFDNILNFLPISDLPLAITSGGTGSGITPIASAVFITTAGSVGALSTTLPSGVQNQITRLGTVVSGTWNSSVIGGTYGGTGVNNGSSTITLGGSMTLSGAFTFAGTLTAPTSVTFPTSGTLATTGNLSSYLPLTGGTLSGDLNIDVGVASGTANLRLRNLSSGGTGANAYLTIATQDVGLGDPAVIWNLADVFVNYYAGIDNTDDSFKIGPGLVVGSIPAISITTAGILSLGAPLALTSGGTGASNAATTGTLLRGNGTAFVPTTSTYPTTNAVNTLLYASSTNVMAALATANNGVLITSAGGNPSISSTLPSGIAATNMSLTTPTLGVATATSVAFSPTTGGIVGTTAADNASAGRVGEFISQTVLFGSAVSVSTGTATDITSFSLTAGDWDVDGVSIVRPAGGATQTNIAAWISISSATLPTAPNSGAYAQVAGVSSTDQVSLPTGTIRINVSGTTNVYLQIYDVFTGGTVSAFGFMRARRVR